jgi:murein DD-endopeptidase MepM/ murein hydrolase activator NlpD
MRLAALAVTLIAAVPPLPGRTLYPPEAWPIVSRFGSLEAVGGGLRPAPNPGIDIIATVRTPVLAAEHAEVTLTGIEARRGKVVELRTTATGRRLTLTYSHLHAIEVALGDTVSPGQRLGTVGDTGQVPRGIGHLSFEVRAPDGLTPLDPEPFLRARPTSEIECADPAADYPPTRFRAIQSGERPGAPFLYPVACTRRP